MAWRRGPGWRGFLAAGLGGDGGGDPVLAARPGATATAEAEPGPEGGHQSPSAKGVEEAVHKWDLTQKP